MDFSFRKVESLLKYVLPTNKSRLDFCFYFIDNLLLAERSVLLILAWLGIDK